MRLLVILLLAALPAIGSIADTRTTRRHLIPAQSADIAPAEAPSLTPATDSLDISGYDKPLRSTRETLFITNRCSTTVTLVTLSLTYGTVAGVMLHSREVTLPCAIPPGETRQLSFPSWDRQKAYYHHLTRVIPRSSKAIPYRTEIKIIGAAFH